MQLDLDFRITKGGQRIGSLDDWLRFAPPAGGQRQWADGASAKEIARAFVAGGDYRVPASLALYSSRHEVLRGCRLLGGEPEVEVKLDGFRGNTRNADLHLVGKGSRGRVLLDVEVKAKERFGTRTVATAYHPVHNKPASNLPTRIDNLCWTLFGRPGIVEGRVDEELANLRYNSSTPSQAH